MIVSDSLESRLDYSFRDKALLTESLTHSSFFHECKVNGKPNKDNERLEFLGDAVLGLTIAEWLMFEFPELREGTLSKWRSFLVSKKTLSEIALEMKLGDELFLGRGEKLSRGNEKVSILACALEAVLGAVYLDGGYETSRRVIQKLFDKQISHLKCNQDFKDLDDCKTLLQEKLQSLYKLAPEYRVIDTWGPEHEKYFKVEILLEGRSLAQGEGRSKKDAEQRAAKVALQQLGVIS